MDQSKKSCSTAVKRRKINKAIPMRIKSTRPKYKDGHWSITNKSSSKPSCAETGNNSNANSKSQSH